MDIHSYSIAFAKCEIMLCLSCRVMDGEMMAIGAVAVFILCSDLGVYSVLVNNCNPHKNFNVLTQGWVKCFPHFTSLSFAFHAVF